MTTTPTPPNADILARIATLGRAALAAVEEDELQDLIDSDHEDTPDGYRIFKLLCAFSDFRQEFREYGPMADAAGEEAGE